MSSGSSSGGGGGKGKLAAGVQLSVQRLPVFYVASGKRVDENTAHRIAAFRSEHLEFLATKSMLFPLFRRGKKLMGKGTWHCQRGETKSGHSNDSVPLVRFFQLTKLKCTVVGWYLGCT